MSAYAKLADILAACDERAWKVSFSELEELLGVSLPASAFKYPAWWSNNPSNNSMTKIWLNAGWRTEQVDIPGKTVVFRRAEAPRKEGAFSGFGDRSRAYEMASTRVPETKMAAWPSWPDKKEAEFAERAIGAAVRKARERAGMSQAELSAKLGKSIDAVKRIEYGQRVHFWAELAKLAEALGSTPNELLGFQSDDPEGEHEIMQAEETRKFRFEDLYGCMKGTITIPEGVDITEPTGEDWEADYLRKWDELLHSNPSEGDR